MAEPNLDAIKYKRTFITEVIARIDFLGALSEINQSVPRSVANIIIKAFPILEPRRIIAQELQISPAQVQAKAEPTESMEWKFHGKERDKFLAASSNSFLVNYSNYASFEILTQEFLEPAAEVFRVFPDLHARRLGLRYINNIELKGANPFSWARYLNKKLLCAFDLSEPKEYISRAFHTLEFNYGESILRFMYGMHNPDYPARIRRRVFVLDFDAYSEQPATFPEIAANLKSFHDSIQRLFELCITDSLREIMNG